MGLDMYLRAHRYVSGFNHSDDKEQFNAVLAALGLQGFRCEDAPSLTVNLTVAYWRKANQIHNWFVQNVQNGKDDCGDYDVSREQIEKLRDLCRKVLASCEMVPAKVENGKTYKPDGTVETIYEDGFVVKDPTTARENLPPLGGFFFGSTNYDHWYVEDLKRTDTTLTGILEDQRFKDDSFIYHSSW